MKNIDFTDFFNVFLSGATIWGVSFLFDMFWVIEGDETRLLLRYHDDL